MDLDRPLIALADPTRRAIFELVRETPRAVGELAREMPVSRPAVSQHLKVLAEAGLVEAEAQGTRRIYRANLRGLEVLREWVDAQWDSVMDGFVRAAEQEATK
jgi:DNA-binding transcriptional ArsR family regulator